MQADMIIVRKSFGVHEIESCVNDTVPPTGDVSSFLVVLTASLLQ